MSIEAVLGKSMGNVPECVAGGVVDLASGMLLAIKTVDSHPREVIDLLAAATTDMFAGPNIQTIEKLFKRARGLKEDNHHYFQELLVNSDNLIHIFMRGKQYSEYVIVYVCRKSANLGMALTKARISLPEIEAAI